MVKVILESPYAGNVARNLGYAKECLLDSLKRGEAPLASHLLYTQILDDTIPEQRSLGLKAGLTWLDCADKHVFYVDHGISDGMREAAYKSVNLGISVEFRRLYSIGKAVNKVRTHDVHRTNTGHYEQQQKRYCGRPTD